MFGAFCTAVQLVLFVVGRVVILPILFKIPLVSHMLRPFVAHFLRGYTPVLLFTQFPTILRAFALGITTLASWEVSEILFDNSISEVHSMPLAKRCIDSVNNSQSMWFPPRQNLLLLLFPESLPGMRSISILRTSSWHNFPEITLLEPPPPGPPFSRIRSTTQICGHTSAGILCSISGRTTSSHFVEASQPRQVYALLSSSHSVP